jgi:DNA invertase Pin-like site-specific DNA recombinase
VPRAGPAAGYEVVRSIREVGSEATLGRAGLAELRRLVRAGAVDVVVVASSDRLSRNSRQPKNLRAELQRADARGAFADGGTGDSVPYRSVIVAVAFLDGSRREA